MSFTTVRAGPLALSDLMFLLSAGVIVLRLLMGDDRDLAPSEGRKGSPMIIAGALLLLTGGALSSLQSWTPLASMEIVARFAWITLAWFWIMRSVCRDRKDLNRLVRGWKATALLSSVAAILGQLGIAFISVVPGDRQTALAGHPNNLGAQLSATFILFLLAVPRDDRPNRRRARVWWFVSLGLCTTAIFSTGSITAVLACLASVTAAGLAYLVTHRPERRHRSPLAPLFLMILLAGGVLVLASSDLAAVDRITRLREGDPYVAGSVDSRGERNALVTGRFDDFLIVGLGLNNFSGTVSTDDEDASDRNFGVHNMYLGMLYQAGLPATVGMLVIIVSAIRQLTILLRRVDPELYTLTLAVLGSFSAVIVTSMFQPVQYDRFFWMPVALTGCIWSIRRRELREAATTAP